MQKFFRKFTSIAIVSMMVGTVFAPQVLAQTASRTVSDIEEEEDNIKALKSNHLYDATGDFNLATLIEDYFDEIGNITENVEDAIKSTNKPISQNDFDDVEEVFSDFKSALTKELKRVDDLISSGSLQTAFNNEEEDFEDEELADAEKAMETLEKNIIGSTTATTSTTSQKIEAAAEDIDEETDDVKALKTDITAMITSTTKSTALDAFFSELEDAGDNVVSILKKLTGTMTAADYEMIDDSVGSFHDEVTKRFTQLTQLTGSGGSLNSIRTSYLAQKSDYNESQRDDIRKQIDRIQKLALGTSGGSALIASSVRTIDDETLEVEEFEESDAVTVTSAPDVAEYFDTLRDHIENVTKSIKKNTGTITQQDFDDLDEAVDNFSKAIRNAYNAIKNNGSGSSFTTAFSNEKKDLGDDIDDMEEALEAVEKKISTINPSTTTPFFDVLTTSEFAIYINALATRNIVNGYSDKSFHPKRNVTRAEFLKMALLAAGKNITPYQATASTFQDVAPAHSLRPYINYASAQQIVSGQTVGGIKYFYPERPISRAEAVIILMRINAIAASTSSTTAFTDVRDAEQGRYISVAAARGIVNGYSATMFGPNDNLTREQAAKIVARISGFTS